MPPFCLPHSTKVLPTASSVTVFQFAENQTLKTPETTFGSGSGAAAAGADAGLSAGFAASAGLAGAAAGAAGLVSAGFDSAGFDGDGVEGWLQAAARAAPLNAPSVPKKLRRDQGRTLRRVSIHNLHSASATAPAPCNYT